MADDATAAATLDNDEWIDLLDESISTNIEPPPLVKRRIYSHGRRPRHATTRPNKPNTSDDPTLPSLSTETHRVEFIAPVPVTAIEWWKQWWQSECADLCLLLVLWALVGGGIYVLNVDVPRAYHDAMWVGVGLFALPMTLYTMLHLVELWTTWSHAKKTKLKVLTR
ncbi:Aste57867_24047 [Aphanomyces stellatus]|uniref:Aste57867_24047 protein n=1 Tax=Aphanomyces stellatus TaxID=120398 RepID=A0A485LP85_9STRA|nr:hypothetical protein As57867_023974 [Aphanomyces stellatus]VFU00690.1 Aste57867_24047 [Aphanomyces stellatus]